MVTLMSWTENGCDEHYSCLIAGAASMRGSRWLASSRPASIGAAVLQHQPQPQSDTELGKHTLECGLDVGRCYSPATAMLQPCYSHATHATAMLQPC